MKDEIRSSIMAKVIYGCDKVADSSWLNYAYSLLIIAGADGRVSKEEMNWLLEDFLAIIEAPPSFKELLLGFDYQKNNLEELLPEISFDMEINYKRVLLYDAIKMARADDEYAEEERNAVQKAAKLLGIPDYMAKTIEGLVSTEKSLEEIRRSIFEFEYDDDDKSKEQTRTSPMLRYVYGLERADEITQLYYGYALMIIAGADGLVSEDERNWYLNRFAKAAKTPIHLIRKIKDYDFSQGNLSEVVSHLSSDKTINFPRTLLYNAIQMARADGEYAEEEKKAVKKAAGLLSIPESITSTMDYLVDTEEKIEKMRKTLFEVKGADHLFLKTALV